MSCKPISVRQVLTKILIFYVFLVTKAEEKINNIKAAIAVFEKWTEENAGSSSNKNAKTDAADKVDTVPGLGFKDKEAAEKTLK